MFPPCLSPLSLPLPPWHSLREPVCCVWAHFVYFWAPCPWKNLEVHSRELRFMEDIDFIHFHLFVEIFHFFFLRTQAVAKEFIISNVGWTVGSVVQLSLPSPTELFPNFSEDIFFQRGPFLSVFIEFVTVLLLFYVFWIFGYKSYEILAAQSGIKPTPSALEDKVLTAGLPENSLPKP